MTLRVHKKTYPLNFKIKGYVSSFRSRFSLFTILKINNDAYHLEMQALGNVVHF